MVSTSSAVDPYSSKPEKEKKLSKCKKLPNTATKEELFFHHEAKIILKFAEKADIYKNWVSTPGIPANINRHTGLPHEHKQEIARNLAKV